MTCLSSLPPEMLNSMGHTEKRKSSFCKLPREILESIAMTLSLPDYLHFRALCHMTWSLFGCSALVPILQKVQTLEKDTSEVWYKDCQFTRSHRISRAHILSCAYRKIPQTDDPVQLEVFLRRIPGCMIEHAARSQNYKVLLSLLIDHGASLKDAPDGINRLCCEAYEQGDFEKFRWLFSKGASFDIVAGLVFEFPGCYRTSSYEARRHYRILMKRALVEGAKPCRSHKASANLYWRRRKGLSNW